MNSLRPLHTAATISQMRREFGVTARALRFYEEQGLLSPVRRQHVRVYSHRDRVRLKLILKGRRVGFTLRELRDLLDLYDQEGAAAQLAKALPLLRRQVTALGAQRSRLDGAIEKLNTALTRLTQEQVADVADKDQRQDRA